VVVVVVLVPDLPRRLLRPLLQPLPQQQRMNPKKPILEWSCFKGPVLGVCVCVCVCECVCVSVAQLYLVLHAAPHYLVFLARARGRDARAAESGLQFLYR